MPTNSASDSFGAVVSLLQQAIDYRETLSSDRKDAQRLYDGDVSQWLPVPQDDKGRATRSSVVSDDVNATIGKLLPGIYRTILGNEIIAEYGAQEEKDQPGSEQATEYINLVVLERSRATKAIKAAIHDAAKHRNGILHVYAHEKVEVRGSTHTNLTDDGLAAIVNEEGVEVLEHEAQQAVEDVEVPGPDGQLQMVQMPVPKHDIKIKRTTRKIEPRVMALPMEEYLIHPDAVNSHEDALLVGREYLENRSTLVAMGFDAERVNELTQATYSPEQEAERLTRRKGSLVDTIPEAHELHPIQVYDLYVRVDADGDGIAELRHVVMCGGMGEENVFVDEYADFVPFYDVVIEELPHQWEGVSITDHVAEIMLAKTALLRGAQDNLYMVNDPQVGVNDRLQNPDAILNRQPGRPLFFKGSDKVDDAVSWNVVPFIADKALMGIAYWDKQIVERCGIDDSSAGLPPDALQNVTAKASAMLEQKGIAKVEMIVKTVADCLKPMFSGLLKLVIQHTDKPDMVRLRNKYVPVDPRSWNADMDVNINVGLGAGTRERDMMVMQSILASQKEIIQMMGANNPYVTPKNVTNTLRKSVQAAGIPVADPFFNNPTDEEIKAYFDAKAQEKPMEIQVIEAQAAAKAQELQASMPIELEMKRMDVEAQREKEIVQSQAAVEERAAIAQIEAQGKADELALKKYEIDTKKDIELLKIQQGSVDAEKDRNANVEQAKAKSFGDSVTKMNETAEKPAKDAGPQLLQIVQELKETLKAANKPRRVIRNAQGDIEGVEPYEKESA